MYIPVSAPKQKSPNLWLWRILQSLIALISRISVTKHHPAVNKKFNYPNNNFHEN